MLELIVTAVCLFLIVLAIGKLLKLSIKAFIIFGVIVFVLYLVTILLTIDVGAVLSSFWTWLTTTLSEMFGGA